MSAGWRTGLPRIDLLTEEEVANVHDHAMTLLEDVGVRIGHPEALAVLVDAGLAVDDDVVRFDRGFVAERTALAPSSFGLRGRDPDRSVTVGDRNVLVAPTGGAPFVLDADGVRRPPTLDDYVAFTRVVDAATQLHLSMSGIVEPDDLPVRTRPLEMDLATIRHTRKPYFSSGVSAETTRDVVALAAIAFGGPEAVALDPPCLGIVNPISPLQYDERMAGSLLEYARGGIPVVLMPFVFSGGTAPLGVAAAVAQMTAEVLAGVALVQSIRPGTPCVFGSSVSELDLHDGRPVYSTASHALAMLISGQMARANGLPFRGGGAFTSSPVPDVRAARESMMSLWPTMLAGANIVVHGAGWLEGSLEASLAKLEEDLPALEELGRVLAAKVDLCDEAFAIDAFRDVGPGGTFLGAAHTLRHLREAASAQAAVPGWKELQDRFEPLPLEPAIDEELVSFVERRKAELGPP